MIVNKNDYSFQTRSDKPNENWLDSDDYYVIDDNSYLAKRIIENHPYINIIESDGVVSDVIVDYTRKEADKSIHRMLQEIEQLKKQLTDTDYQAIKHSEGQISDEEYESIKLQRQAWRDRINELESMIENGIFEEVGNETNNNEEIEIEQPTSSESEVANNG